MQESREKNGRNYRPGSSGVTGPERLFFGCCVYIHSRDIHSFEIQTLKVSGNENRIDWFLS